jgi:hypothetical protein
MKTPDRHQGASALLYVVLTMAVLLAGAAAVLRPVSDEFANTFRTASWQEALLAAESGIDLATVQMRANLQSPGAEWPAPWTTVPDTAQIAARAAAGKTELVPAPVIRKRTTTWRHGGEGGELQTVEVQVDAPAELIDPVSGFQYYRVRSKGTLSFGGSRRAAGEKRDSGLRKMSLVRDRFTGTKLDQPSVARTVEVIVRPSSAFPVALLSKDTTTISNQNVVVDSYDSSDDSKSTGGQYDVLKRQQHGDVATDGTLIAAGSAHIYGNVSTNGGTVTGVQNITGTIRDDYYQDVPSVVAPTWTTYTPAIVRTNTNLATSSVRGGARYKMSDITLSGTDTLQLVAPNGGGSGSQIRYIELWVDGNISITGSAAILLDKNVIATIYVAGDMNIAGNGIGNASNAAAQSYERPANVQIYGLKPTDPTVVRSIKLAGNAQVEASIYAPDANAEIVGGGSNGDFSGSVVGKTIFMNGVTQVHYDESLIRNGLTVGYRIVSWLEDTR